MVRGIRTLIAVTVLLAGASIPAMAQQTGSIRGQVVAQATLRPLSGVQVVVTGTSRGVLTDERGQFLLVGVPAGSHDLRVQHLGYGSVGRTIRVVGNGAVEANFELSERAIALDGIVVTGQPGETRRREVGAAVASIEADRRVRENGIGTLNQLLQGREPGVTSIGASGTAGAAGTLVLRGMTSVTQTNSPAVYIDGVRIDTSEKPLFLLGLGGQTTSRLNDIDPADIERVEVVRGAAASALYGSEASSGVIQIFTKKGVPGESTISASMKYGATRIPDVFPVTHPDPQYPSANDLLQTGAYRQANVSLRGGTERIRHYVSASYLGDEGSFPSNSFDRANGTLSLWLMPHENVTAEVFSKLAWSQAQLPYNDNHVLGPLINILAGNPEARGSATDPWGGLFLPGSYVLDIDNTDETYRYTGGLTVEHRIAEGLSHKATVGGEFVAGEGVTIWPYAPNPLAPQGARLTADREGLSGNVDYSANWTTPVGESFESSLSFGAQVRSYSDHRVYANGAGFVAPYLQLLGATTGQWEVDEEILEYTTGGLFVQEQVGLNDRLFVTAGVRVDGSSAFGDNLGLQAYPKLSASWVASDEPWFNVAPVSELRFRGGYGLAGTLPGAFDAQRTYLPFTAGGGRPALGVGEIGNPDLAPETTREWEAGVDAELFTGRLSLSASYYDQETQDALLRRPVAPSLGSSATQLTNLGTIRNRGVELSSRATLLQTSLLSWSASASYAWNENEVVDMGGVAPIVIDRFGTTMREGYPIGAKWQRVSVGTAPSGFPIPSDTAVYLGTGVPVHTGSLESRVTLGNFDVFGNAQWAAGHVVTNNTRSYMTLRGAGEEFHSVFAANDYNPGAPEVQQLFARASLLGDFTEAGDWMKIRELGLSYSLPGSLASRIGADRAAITLSGRNLFTFTGYSGPDPEVSSTVGYFNTAAPVVGQELYTTASVGNDFFTVPQARQWVLGVDVQF